MDHIRLHKSYMDMPDKPGSKCPQYRMPRRKAPKKNALIRYDTRCYFNVCSKANMSQLNLPHGTDN